MKRGHSNVHAEQTKPWHQPKPGDGQPYAKIPLVGGAQAVTTKELPPLALRKQEWEEIGRRMGWTT